MKPCPRLIESCHGEMGEKVSKLKDKNAVSSPTLGTNPLVGENTVQTSCLATSYLTRSAIGHPYGRFGLVAVRTLLDRKRRLEYTGLLVGRENAASIELLAALARRPSSPCGAWCSCYACINIRPK